MKKKIFAFDMGKASIGYCVREGHDLKEANSVLIEKEHASYDDIRGRRRINKTLNAHIAREKFFDDLWLDCGLELLDKDDMHIKKEFPSTGEDVIYTSCLLRAALVQNIKLEQWQIYKALRNAIQRRGYDVNIPWKSSQNDDDRENEERTKNYTQSNGVELISDEKYRYPCYYDALRLGLWSEKYPDKFRRSIPLDNSNKVRTTEYVAPRSLVERELIVLWLNAQSQIPELNKYDAEYFLYGEYRSAYASYLQKEFRQYMGTENDWQGVLGQKIPRFNNRIISKCKLLPERNVSRADCFENVSFLMLMKLKNLRIKDGTGESIRFSPEDINKIYNEWVKKMQSNDNKLDT
ncbi:MAG: hypothetical protein LUB59_07960, partial [Candidatus Gastranaerophilales bacterium]|nr:hypothetical protein [Candidatus Gastranaerophilales bacterium]